MKSKHLKIREKTIRELRTDLKTDFSIAIFIEGVENKRCVLPGFPIRKEVIEYFVEFLSSHKTVRAGFFEAPIQHLQLFTVKSGGEL